jgi:hypothetical protein
MSASAEGVGLKAAFTRSAPKKDCSATGTEVLDCARMSVMGIFQHIY